MFRSLPIILAKVFLKMHLRDRQAIIFSLFFSYPFHAGAGFYQWQSGPDRAGIGQ